MIQHRALPQRVQQLVDLLAALVAERFPPATPLQRLDGVPGDAQHRPVGGEHASVVGKGANHGGRDGYDPFYVVLFDLERLVGLAPGGYGHGQHRDGGAKDADHNDEKPENLFIGLVKGYRPVDDDALRGEQPAVDAETLQLPVIEHEHHGGLDHDRYAGDVLSRQDAQPHPGRLLALDPAAQQAAADDPPAAHRFPQPVDRHRRAGGDDFHHLVQIVGLAVAVPAVGPLDYQVARRHPFHLLLDLAHQRVVQETELDPAPVLRDLCGHGVSGGLAAFRAVEDDQHFPGVRMELQGHVHRAGRVHVFDHAGHFFLAGQRFLGVTVDAGKDDLGAGEDFLAVQKREIQRGVVGDEDDGQRPPGVLQTVESVQGVQVFL